MLLLFLTKIREVAKCCSEKQTIQAVNYLPNAVRPQFDDMQVMCACYIVQEVSGGPIDGFGTPIKELITRVQKTLLIIRKVIQGPSVH